MIQEVNLSGIQTRDPDVQLIDKVEESQVCKVNQLRVLVIQSALNSKEATKWLVEFCLHNGKFITASLHRIICNT